MTTAKDLSSKSETELAAIAADLGLDLDPNATTPKAYIAAIVAASKDKGVTINMEKLGANELVDLADAEPHAITPKTKKVRIIIHNQDGAEATTHIKVGVNDYKATIPRDVEVIVPDFVVEVLNNAKVMKYDPEGTPIGMFVRHPFTVLGPA